MSRLDTITYLRKVLEELEEERDVLDKQIDSIRSAVNILESRPEAEYASSKQAQALRDSIYEILSEQHPLHRRTIYDKLVERGIKVGGQDPVNNVGAHLSRDARFRNVGRGEWDLDERYTGQAKDDNQHALPAITEETDSGWPSEVIEASVGNDSGYGSYDQGYGGYAYEDPRKVTADDLPW